jgi:hypothetical protein
MVLSHEILAPPEQFRPPILLTPQYFAPARINFGSGRIIFHLAVAFCHFLVNLISA